MSFKEIAELYVVLFHISVDRDNSFEFGLTEDGELWISTGDFYHVFRFTEKK